MRNIFINFDHILINVDLIKKLDIATGVISTCFYLCLFKINILLNKISTSAISNILNIYRTCPTRIATGTSNASSVPSAAALWWKRLLPPRMICCCAQNAMPMIIPQSVPPAKKPSCQVHYHAHVGHNTCIVINKNALLKVQPWPWTKYLVKQSHLKVQDFKVESWTRTRGS